MINETTRPLTGILLSLAIVVGMSLSLRMVRGQAVEAAPSPFVVACAQ